MLEQKVPVAQAPGIEVSTTVARRENRAISRVHLLLHSRHAGPVRETAAGQCWNMLLSQVCPPKGSREKAVCLFQKGETLKSL